MKWNPFNRLTWVLLALIAIATSLAGSAWLGYSNGKQSGITLTQAKWDADKVVQLEANSLAVVEAGKRQKDLEAKVAQLNQEKKDEAKRLTARYDSLVVSLRNRPEARAGAGGVPEAPNSGTGCTGAGLARPDGEFLARYSADAARLRDALATCKAGYRAIGGHVID